MDQEEYMKRQFRAAAHGSGPHARAETRLMLITAGLMGLIQQAYEEGYNTGRSDAQPTNNGWDISAAKRLLETISGTVPEQREYKFINEGDFVYRLIETGGYRKGVPETENEFLIRVEGRRHTNKEQLPEIAALIADLLNLYYQK